MKQSLLPTILAIGLLWQVPAVRAADKLSLASPGGEIRIVLEAWAQPTYALSVDPDPQTPQADAVQHGFRLRRAFVSLKGSVWQERLRFHASVDAAAPVTDLVSKLSTETTGLQDGTGAAVVGEDGQPVDVLRSVVGTTKPAQSAFLQDLYVDLVPSPWFVVRLGQAKSAYSAEFLASSWKLLTTDRPVTYDLFDPGRDIGIMVLGGGERIQYDAGVFNGEGRSVKGSTDPSVLVAGRVEGTPLGEMNWDQGSPEGTSPPRLGVGFGAAWEPLLAWGEDGELISSISDLRLAWDARFRVAGLFLFAELYWQGLLPDEGEMETERLGGVFSGSYAIANRVEPGARFAFARTAQGEDLDGLWVLEALANVYPAAPGKAGGHEFKIQVSYGLSSAWVRPAGGEPTSARVHQGRVLVQLKI